MVLKTQGILQIHMNSWLAVTCDWILFNTPFGPLLIYKNQGEIHIEFPKPLSPKIITLNNALKKYEYPSVLDCTCGPGTLGIAALKGGAKRVVFNDLWYPAAYTTALNLELNGFPVEITDKSHGLIAKGKFWEVYSLDVVDLGSALNETFDLGVVDTFPGVNTERFLQALKDLCKEVVII